MMMLARQTDPKLVGRIANRLIENRLQTCCDDAGLIDYVKRITGKTSKTRNEGQEKGRKPKQKTRGDAEEPTETQRLPQHRVPRWKERAKST